MRTFEPDEVEELLKATGKDRSWLAGELGCNRGTLNNWFSAGTFPLWAQKSMGRIFAPILDPLPDTDLKFNLADWKLIQNAVSMSGAQSVEEFVAEAAKEKAKELVQREKTAPKAGRYSTSSVRDEIALVREDSDSDDSQ